MKYKLINNKTKEETICEKVEIDGFDYYVSDDKITNYYYNPATNNIHIESNHKRLEVVNKHKRLKIIATNNPIIDIPKVLCKEIEESFKVKADIPYFPSDLKETCHWWYKEGYNKAKETYHFTVQDMLDFGKYCINNQLCKEENRYYQYWELLQIFKEQQIKTIFYE